MLVSISLAPFDTTILDGQIQWRDRRVETYVCSIVTQVSNPPLYTLFQYLASVTLIVTTSARRYATELLLTNDSGCNYRHLDTPFRLVSPQDSAVNRRVAGSNPISGATLTPLVSIHAFDNTPLGELCLSAAQKNKLPILTRISYFIRLALPPVSPQ
jgi:hypothetical protein